MLALEKVNEENPREGAKRDQSQQKNWRDTLWSHIVHLRKERWGGIRLRINL